MRFDALTAGSGDLVILLHGFPQTASCWRPALNTLARAGFRAVAPTQRGYSVGAQPDGVNAYRVSELCEDVLAVAEALGSTRFHLIGHDWGGTVAWALTGEFGDSIATLTAISTPHTAALAEALRGRDQRLRMAYIPVLRVPQLAERVFDAAGGALAVRALVATGLSPQHARRDVEALRRVGTTGALNWYRAIGRDPVAHTRPVAVPTLHVWGDGDVAFGRAATELTAQYVEAPYHLLELEGGSHWIPDEHWMDTADLVDDHLTVRS